jgi:hypothetical protein
MSSAGTRKCQAAPRRIIAAAYYRSAIHGPVRVVHAAFTLFGDDANVLYDNISDRIAGGHAILTVAAKPTGGDVWLQDYVHMRIVGTNPTETIVRKYVHNALAQRDGNIECMADAVFAWENAMQQFDPAVRTHTSYRGVRFNWPQDPADMPSVAFDYGIGLGQFTHPGQETVGVCWDWRDNLNAGMNELLDDLRSMFAAGRTFLAWAINAWSMYAVLDHLPARPGSRSRMMAKKSRSMRHLPASTTSWRPRTLSGGRRLQRPGPGR